jgi:hypothetical protein
MLCADHTRAPGPRLPVALNGSVANDIEYHYKQSVSHLPFSFRRSALGFCVVAPIAWGCNDEARIVTTDPNAGALSPSHPNAPGEASPSSEPSYAIASTSFGPEGESSYVALVPSLGASTTIDYESVLPIAGGASLFGQSQGHFFGLGTAEEPTITRFDVGAEGVPIETGSLSLLAYGVANTWLDPGLVPILSETKAYVIDSSQMQVIVWDPAAMRVTGSFPLEGVPLPGFEKTLFEPDPTLRDGQLLIVATHGQGDATAQVSTLIVLDVNEDRLVRVARDERCGGLWDSVLDSRGDLYLATGVWDAAQNRTLGATISTAPCLLRVNAGETEFDPGYFVEMSSLAAGQTAGALVAGANDRAFIKVLDETGLGDIGADSFDEVWSGAHWRWWRLDLGSSAIAEPTGSLPPSAAASGVLTVNGTAFVRNASADFSQTTLLDMSGDEPLGELTLRGFPYGIVRVR